MEETSIQAHCPLPNSLSQCWTLIASILSKHAKQFRHTILSQDLLYASNGLHEDSSLVSVILARNDITAYIKSLLPWTRQVVLVGHDIDNDLRALDSLQFDYSGFRILDTVRISREVFPRSSLTLSRLLLKLECPHSRLHCAGNDANFTPRALILLAINMSVGRAGLCQEKLAVMKGSLCPHSLKHQASK